MAKILKAGLFKLGLLDSDTGISLNTLKAVDITAECRLSMENDNKSRVILLFTRAKRGRMVRIMIPYRRENYGPYVSFFVDELGKEMDKKMNVGPGNDAFGTWTKRLGLKNKTRLRNLIKRHAPGKIVVFQKKSTWQPDNCINHECGCSRRSTLEAVAGNAQIRCCNRVKCKKNAAMFAKFALEAGL